LFQKNRYQKFKSLDKESLILLTTYEPCTMCKGAIQEYGIKKVVFSFAKRKGDKILNFKNDLKYYYHLKQTKNKRLQYDLFKLHPDFDTIQYPY
jgi:tRNA(Arg) A34 adenosine deaminase TadA